MPASIIDEIVMGWLCVFLTKKACTVEPRVVNTVSKSTEVCENESLAELLVTVVSFLHENEKAETRNKRITRFLLPCEY